MMKNKEKAIICLGFGALLMVVIGLGTYMMTSSEANQKGNNYFMRYYDHSFPVSIRSLQMDHTIVTNDVKATLNVELIDELSNDNKTYWLMVTPQDITHDGNDFWNISPFEHRDISFEHNPRQFLNFTISAEEFAGSCMTENLIVSLAVINETSNGNKGGPVIDSEKIPIISQYPEGNGKLCY